MDDTAVDFRVGAPVVGNLDVDWIHGSPSRRHNTDPPTPRYLARYAWGQLRKASPAFTVLNRKLNADARGGT